GADERRAAGRTVLEPARSPGVNRRRLRRRDLRRGDRPPLDQLALKIALGVPERPVAALADDDKIARGEALRRLVGRFRTERDAEPLVGSLVLIDERSHRLLVAVLRCAEDPAVVAELEDRHRAGLS